MKNAESAISHSYSSFTYTDKYTFYLKKKPTIQGISGIMTIHTSGDLVINM